MEHLEAGGEEGTRRTREWGVDVRKASLLYLPTSGNTAACTEVGERPILNIEMRVALLKYPVMCELFQGL